MSPAASGRGFRAPAMTRPVAFGTGIALLGCALTAWNRLTLPRLSRDPAPVVEPVTVCVPARDEADRLPRLIRDLRAQTGLPRLRILILDDDSTDGTSAAATAAMDDDPRCVLLRGTAAPPTGWTGKSAACATLAARATAAQSEPSILVFVDADVRLAPTAVAAAVGELRRRNVALLSAWPRQRAESPAERLVQPLLCWSWASTLPVACTDRGLRPSTAVACGQFLVIDSAAYRSIGGHAAVADSVTEDLDIARDLRRAGYPTALAAAGGQAATRMYCGTAEVEAGYTRWLWSAYGGSPAGGAAVAVVAAVAYWLPPAAAVFGHGRLRRIGLLGYAAAVAGRLLAVSIETGGRPRGADIAAGSAHPVSIAGYLLLWARSHRARRRGTLSWKGRCLPPRPARPAGLRR